MTRDDVIAAIEAAFRGVSLGDGVGLWQGQSLDMHGTVEDIAAARRNDEKDDWHKLQAADLNTCHSSLSFFDSAGMRFHLPAFMIADLRGEYDFGVTFALTYRFTDHIKDTLLKLAKVYRAPGEVDKTNLERGDAIFGGFSIQQASAVVDFLTFKLEQTGADDISGDKSAIEEALLNYWWVRAEVKI